MNVLPSSGLMSKSKLSNQQDVDSKQGEVVCSLYLTGCLADSSTLKMGQYLLLKRFEVLSDYMTLLPAGWYS
jgi:hypothetical protein